MFTFSPNTKAKSAEVNQNFTDVTTGAADTSDNNLRLFRAESAANFVSTGLVWSTASGLIGAMTTGVMYVVNPSGLMVRVLPAAITSKTFTVSKDTYIDIDYNGLPVYVEVANGATTGFALTANSIRVAKVVTGAAAITSIAISGIDGLNNFMRNTNPYGFTTVQTPTYLNGWLNYDTAYGPTFFAKDKTGTVHIHGLVRTGTITAGTPIFNLPAGFRPPVVVLVAGASNDAFTRIDVTPAGDVKTGAGANASWITLSNIKFVAAA